LRGQGQTSRSYTLLDILHFQVLVAEPWFETSLTNLAFEQLLPNRSAFGMKVIKTEDGNLARGLCCSVDCWGRDV